MNADACASASGALLPVPLESTTALEDESSTTDSEFALLMAALPQPVVHSEVADIAEMSSGTASTNLELPILQASVNHAASVSNAVHHVVAPALSRVLTSQPPDLEMMPPPVATDLVHAEDSSDLTPFPNLLPTIDGLDLLSMSDNEGPSPANHSDVVRFATDNHGELGQAVVSIEFETDNTPDQSQWPEARPAVESTSIPTESERHDIVDETSESRTVKREMSLNETDTLLPQQWVSVKLPGSNFTAALVQSSPSKVEVLSVVLLEHYRQQSNTDSRLIVRLDPPNLGAVIVRLSRKVAGTKVEIFAERDALNVIRDQVAAIREALQHQADVREFEVTVTTSGSGFFEQSGRTPTQTDQESPPQSETSPAGYAFEQAPRMMLRKRTGDSHALSFLA